MDTVAPVRLFPEPTGKVRLPFRHLGCFQIVDGAPLHQRLNRGRIRGIRQNFLCPGQCAFRQGKINFQCFPGKGAALAAVGEGIAGGAAGVRQGPAGENGAGAGIVRKIDKVLHRKGFYGKGALFLPPAVKVLGTGRIRHPAPAGIGIKILAPEVYAAVFGGCHRQHRHSGPFSAGKGSQVTAPVHLGNEGIRGEHPGAAPEFCENRLPDRGRPVNITFLGIAQQQRPHADQHRQRRPEGQTQALQGAVFPGAGGQQQHTRAEQQAGHRPAFRILPLDHGAQRHRRRGKQNGHQACPSAQHTAAHRQAQAAAIDTQRQLRVPRLQSGKGKIAPMVYSIQKSAHIIQKALDLPDSFRPVEQVPQSQGAQRQGKLTTPAQGQHKNAEQCRCQKGTHQGWLRKRQGVHRQQTAQSSGSHRQRQKKRPESVGNGCFHGSEPPIA